MAWEEFWGSFWGRYGGDMGEIWGRYLLPRHARVRAQRARAAALEVQRLYCGVGAAVAQLLQRVHAVLEVAHQARVLHLAHLG